MQSLSARQTDYANELPKPIAGHFSEKSIRTYLDWNGCCSVHVSSSSHGLFRKEVIQPQVLLRLPCYDFTPIMNHTLGRCLPCGLAYRLLVQPTFVM